MTVDTETITDLEAFVMLGFRYDTSCDFRVTLPRDREQARRVLGAVGCYNRFEPDEAWAIADGWWRHVTHVELARDRGVNLTFHLCPGSRESRLEHAVMLRRELRDIGAYETTCNLVTGTVGAWWD